MPGITNWHEALADPRFWAIYYGVDLFALEGVFGVSEQECNQYFLTMMGCAEQPELLDEENAYELVDGSVLYLSFPQEYTWIISMGPEGDLHMLLHPTQYPDGVLMAEVSGHQQLPGLRWRELQRMDLCFQSYWQDEADRKVLIPLLYPVVESITEEDEEEVRQTLSTIWDGLGVLLPGKRDFWLDEIIKISDEGSLWAFERDAGWYSLVKNSPRRHPSEGWPGHADFRPFFTMLEHY